MNREKIEQQIATLRKGYSTESVLTEPHVIMGDCLDAADTLQALLDVAVAANDYMTYGPLHANMGQDIAHNRLSHALAKLSEVAG